MKLVHVSEGEVISVPSIEVFDSEFGEEARELAAGQSLQLARGSARTVDLVMGSPGWTLVTHSLDIDEDSPDIIEVRAEPKYSFVLEVVEEATKMPVESFQVRTAWEYAGIMRREAPPIEANAPQGEFLIEGIPIDEGRFRAEVSAEGYYLVRSDWIEARPGEIPVVHLILKSRGASSAQLRVSLLERLSGSPVAGTPVHLFPETGESTIRGLMVSSTQLSPTRSSFLDPDLIDEIPPEISDENGAAAFTVAAPGRYRIVVGGPGFATVLGDAIDLEPGVHEELEVLLDAPAALRVNVLEPTTLASRQALSAVQAADLRNDEFYLSTPILPDESFLFGPIAPGNYTLSIDGGAQEVGGRVFFMTLLSREISLEPGENASVVLDLDAHGSGGIVRGKVLDPFFGAESSQLIAIVRSAKDDREGPPERPLAVTAPAAEGSFEFRGVPSGKWIVFAIGHTEDERTVCLLWGEIELTDAGQQPQALTLEARGEPLVLYGEAVASPEQTRVAFEVAGLTPLFDELVQALPRLLVVSGETSRVIGLPPGAVTVHQRKRVIDVGRSTEVGLASSVTLTFD